MTLPKGLLILGFGGQARSVADVAMSLGINQLLFVDPNAREHEQFSGFSVWADFSCTLPEDWFAMPTAGDNFRRQIQVQEIEYCGWPLATVVSPTATVGVGAVISPGCFVGHHAHIGPMAQVGVGCIINTGAIIEHECIIGDYCHVSVNTTVAGRSKIGNFTFLGAGSTVIDGISVWERVCVGAGGVVIKDICEAGTYVGIPVRKVRG